MGMLYKRGDVWWIKYYRDGRAIRESAGSAKEGDAKRLLKLREGDVERGVPIVPKVGRLRFDEAIADLLADYDANGKRSAKLLEQRVAKHLEPHFRGRRMASITTADLTRYVTVRQGEGAANATVNRELAAMRRAFSLATKAGKLVWMPHVPMLREDNARKGFFAADEFGRVCANLPEALRPLVTFAYRTGWRIPSEVPRLQWRHVDFAAGEIRLDADMTKTRTARTFPMTSELRALLEAQRDYTRAIERERSMVIALVFHRAGKPIRGFRRAWKTACKAAGCPGRLVHDLRRTAVRALVRAGVPERVAMDMAGHRTRSVFERYNIVSPGDLRDAGRRLDAGASNA